jgi:hypothetical protein
VEIRPDALANYPDVLTPEVVAALHELAPLDDDRHAVMAERLARARPARANSERIAFLDPASIIPRTSVTWRTPAPAGFTGSASPPDPAAQWIQGTGPGAKPSTPVDKSIRNSRYALLSGADGWMFDGEDALGQLSTMSLDNQRNLKLAIPQGGRVPDGDRGRGRRDERRGRSRSSAGRSSATGGSSSGSPPRSSAPAGCTSTIATCAAPDGGGFSRRSSISPPTW